MLINMELICFFQTMIKIETIYKNKRRSRMSHNLRRTIARSELCVTELRWKVAGTG